MFNNLKIGAKITAILAVILSIMILLIIGSFVNVNKIRKMTDVSAQRAKDAQTLTNAANMSSVLYSVWADLIINQEYSVNRKLWDSLSTSQKNDLKIVEKIVDTEAEKLIFKQAEQEYEKILKHYDPLVTLVQLESKEEIKNLDFEIDTYKTNYSDLLIQIQKSILKESEAATIELNNLIDFINLVSIIVGVLSILISIFLGMYLTRKITRPLSKAVTAANNIALGNLNVDLESSGKDETVILLNSLKEMSNTIKSMVEDINELSNGCVAGKLDVRADANKYNGQYNALVSGINHTLDAVINPLNITAEYVDRIAKGDIPPKITEKYNGDFNEIKNNLNMAIDAINFLVSDSKALANAAVEGKLDTRADASKHQGDFRAIVAGVNETLDSVIGPLNVAAEYVNRISKGDIPELITDNYNGDFNEIKDNLNTCINAVNLLVTDAKALANAAVEGKLNTRADASKHQGDFRAIVAGVNDTLDNVIGPLNVAADYVEKISKGDIPAIIKDNYNGDFNAIKNNLNSLIEATNNVTTAAKMIASGDTNISLSKRSANDEMIEGVMNIAESIKQVVNGVNEYISYTYAGEIEKIKFDTSLYEGDFKKIFEGLNQAAVETVTPLLEILTVMKSLEQGDLTLQMTGDYRGGFAMLKEAANNSISSFNDLLSQVSVTVEEVTKGSMQVSDASTALSQGATEQAASLEEITSSMSEVGAQTRENAQNANQANMLTNEAKDAADKGDKEMNQLNKAMDEISESSKNISKIIRVIDEIAFQTNLLALNAAVEAARAGRHGKGFAVVAEEVRNLAARSASAARETSSMIEDSIKSVETGGILAHRTAEALEDIKNGSIKAADIVAEIAALSNEQAQVIAQINEGLNQIDKVTQTNTASAEESASASEELSGQAGELKIMLTKFKLMKNGSNIHSELPGFNENSKNIFADNQYKPRKRALPNKRASVATPEDFISLDEDDFDRY